MFTDYTSMLTMAGTGTANFTTVGLSAELTNINSMYQMLGGQGSTDAAGNTKAAGNTQTSNYNNYVDYLNGNTGSSNTSTTNNTNPGNATAAASTANGSATLDSSNLVTSYLKSYYPNLTDDQIAGINAYYDQFYGQLESAFADYAGSLGQFGMSAGVSGLLADCKKMVGLNEHDDRSEINKITGKSGVDCKTIPWCAAWAMNMLNDHGVLDTSSCSNVNSCPTVKSWAQNQGIWKSHSSGYTPQPGDAIMFDWDGNGGAQHIGIVERVENGKVYTIEGNASDSVKEKSYSLSSGYILGYIACAEQKR
ncbi:MAG: CHAP domain-containing protein [bacterium]|nr:CHAP domain-containing protein [bacterium]